MRKRQKSSTVVKLQTENSNRLGDTADGLGGSQNENSIWPDSQGAASSAENAEETARDLQYARWNLVRAGDRVQFEIASVTGQKIQAVGDVLKIYRNKHRTAIHVQSADPLIGKQVITEAHELLDILPKLSTASTDPDPQLILPETITLEQATDELHKRREAWEASVEKMEAVDEEIASIRERAKGLRQERADARKLYKQARATWKKLGGVE